MHSKQIGLGQRIINPEYLREVIDGFMSAFKSEMGLVLESLGRIDANGDTSAVIFSFSGRFDIFKVTDRPSEELQRLI